MIGKKVDFSRNVPIQRIAFLLYKFDGWNLATGNEEGWSRMSSGEKKLYGERALEILREVLDMPNNWMVTLYETMQLDEVSPRTLGQHIYATRELK